VVWFGVSLCLVLFSVLVTYLSDKTKNIPKTDLAMPSEESTCAVCNDSEGKTVMGEPCDMNMNHLPSLLTRQQTVTAFGRLDLKRRA
jgi:hypothetical protein